MRRKSANDKVVRVVEMYETDLEQFEKVVSGIGEYTKILELEDDETKSVIHDALWDIGGSEVTQKFIKELAEREFDTTELMQDLAKDIPIDELYSMLESNEDSVSEGQIYMIQKNMSERVKNILRKIVQ